MVVPRIPLRTLLVERGIVLFTPEAGIAVQAPDMPLGTGRAATPKSYTASEPEFFDTLETNRPGLSTRLRSFVASLEELQIFPDFRKSLILRWQPGPDLSVSVGVIDNKGSGWFGDAVNQAAKLGKQEAGDRYVETLARLVGGSVRRYAKAAPMVVGSDGRSVDVDRLLSHAPAWQEAMSVFVQGMVEAA